MFQIGRGRYARETYPEANKASAAFQNRLISGLQALANFTPSGGIVGAALVTPRASGIFMVLGSLTLVNDALANSFSIGAAVAQGPGLTVTGGSVTDGGWTFGTTVPPVIGGVPVLTQIVSVFDEGVVASASVSLPFLGMNPVALPVNVPVVIELTLSESVPGHAVTGVSIKAQLVELP